MALIGEIRKRSGLLIIAIGGAMVLFVLSDFFSQGSSIFASQETDVAIIGGEAVTFVEFEARLQNELAQNPNNRTVNEAQKEAIRERIWQMLLQEKILYKEYDELGISVNPEELFEQVNSDNPSPILAQYLTNPETGRIYDEFSDPVTGGLNSTAVLQWLKEMFANEQGSGAWLPIERMIKLDRYMTKYHTLIKKAVYVTSKEAEWGYQAENRKAKFRYVLKSFDAIADSSIEVSDEDIKAYYKEHKEGAAYQQKETTRAIEYVTFEVFPSDDDLAMIREDLEKLKNDLAETEEDTLFINQHADTPGNLGKVGINDGFFPADIDTIIFDADTGAVFGPYEDGGAYKLAKVLGSEFIPDSVKARHILIRLVDGDTATAQAKADSIKAVVESQDNFVQMATDFSEDFASAQDSGNLGWFKEGSMVPEFNDACFGGEIGELQMVQTQFGFHIIEVRDKSEVTKRLHVAVIDHKMEPSKMTRDEMYNKASAFAINNETPEKFKQNGNELGIMVANYIKEGDKTLPGLESPRPLIRWAYKAEKGQISEPFELGDKFIVAHLTEIKEKGTLALEVDEVKERVKIELLKEKKAEKLIKSMSGFSSLDELSRSVSEEVETVEELAFSSFSIPGIGAEHGLIGKLFSMEKGQMSAPVKGNLGVFVVQIDQFVDAPPTTDYSANKQQLEQGITGSVDYSVFNALKESANIVDNRAKFY